MSFANCTDAYNQGYANIPRSSALYDKKLDRDNDGIGCENPPPGFVAKAMEKTDPAQTSTGTKVETGAGTGTTLPKTGPAVEVGLAGAAILLLGLAGAMIARRRKVRFTA